MAQQPRENVFAKTDWKSYKVFRPEYPSSLIDLIISYHRAKGGQFQLAHDVGAGNGTFATHLTPYFSHIHLSDPSASNIDEAKSTFSQLSSPTFTFSTHPAEQSHTAQPEATVDLLTLAEAAHWTDIDATVPSIARALRPHGTLAIIYYDVLPHLLDVSPAMRAAWTALVRRAYADSLALLQRIDHLIGRRTGAGGYGNAYVPLPEDLFETGRTRRLNLNVRGDAPGAFRIPERTVEVPGLNRVRDGEAVEEWNSPDDVARGWQVEVGPGWLKGAFMTMPPVKARMDEYEEELAQVDEMIAGMPGGRVMGEFPVAVLLATRR